jgi:hypothetical protein
MDIITLFWQLGQAMQKVHPLNREQYAYYEPYFQTQPDTFTLLIPKDGQLITQKVQDENQEERLGFVEYIRARSLFPSLTVRPKHIDLLFNDFLPFYLNVVSADDFHQSYAEINANFQSGLLQIDGMDYADFCSSKLDEHTLFVLADEHQQPLMARKEFLEKWFYNMKGIHHEGKCSLCGKEGDLVTPKSRLTKGWTLYSSTRKSQVHPDHQLIRCSDCEYAIDRVIGIVEKVSFLYRTRNKDIQYAYLPIIFSKEEVDWLINVWSRIEQLNRLDALANHLHDINMQADKPILMLELKYAKTQAQFEMLDVQLVHLDHHQIIKTKKIRNQLDSHFDQLAIDSKMIPKNVGQLYKYKDDSERFLYLYTQLFYSFMGYTNQQTIQTIKELEKKIQRSSEYPLSLIYFKVFLHLLYDDERGEIMNSYMESKEYAIGVIFRTAMELQAESPMYFQNNYQDLLQTAIARKILYGTRIDLNRALGESMRVIRYKSRYIGSPQNYRAKTLEVATSKLDRDWLPDRNQGIEAFHMANVAYPHIIKRPERKASDDTNQIEEEIV